MNARYLGYGLVIVLSVIGFVSGLLMGPTAWLLVGLALGLFILGVWFFIRSQSATVQQADGVVSGFLQLDAMTGIIALVVWAVVVGLTYVFYRFVLNLAI